MNRRSFLKGVLAAGVAPYVCTTAGVLMPVRRLWTPEIYIVTGASDGVVKLLGLKSGAIETLYGSAFRLGHLLRGEPVSGGVDWRFAFPDPWPTWRLAGGVAADTLARLEQRAKELAA